MTDQEIRDALRVDPSPAFLARVRTRIASEPAPSAWRWSWTIAAVGAMAATVLIAVVMSRPRHEKPPAPDVAHAFTPAEAPAGSTLQQTEPAGSTAVRRPGPSASARLEAPRAPARLAEAQSAKADSRTVPAQMASEILLDPAETRALRGLIAGVRDGRVDLSAAQMSTTPAAMDLEPLADIVINPITIEPIAPPSGAEGARP
jgi:hypothetical protein